jgi:hypothetical protein
VKRKRTSSVNLDKVKKKRGFVSAFCNYRLYIIGDALSWECEGHLSFPGSLSLAVSAPSSLLTAFISRFIL